VTLPPPARPKIAKLGGYVQARYMFDALQHQVDMYDASVKAWGYDDGKRAVAPQSMDQLFDVARQQLDRSIALEPQTAHLDDAARAVRESLQPAESAFDDLADYYHVEEGWRAGGAAKSKAVARDFHRAWKPFARAVAAFGKRLDTQLQHHFRACAKSGDDPFLRKVCATMAAAHELAYLHSDDPHGKAFARALDHLTHQIDAVQTYVRKHGAELDGRYGLVHFHRQFPGSAKDLLKQARDARRAHHRGPLPAGDVVFLKMAFRSMMGLYQNLAKN